MTKRVHKIKNQPIPLACLSTHVQSMESTLEAKLVKRSKPVMAYLLVNLDSDDSVSVISYVKGERNYISRRAKNVFQMARKGNI